MILQDSGEESRQAATHSEGHAIKISGPKYQSRETKIFTLKEMEEREEHIITNLF